MTRKSSSSISAHSQLLIEPKQVGRCPSLNPSPMASSNDKVRHHDSAIVMADSNQMVLTALSAETELSAGEHVNVEFSVRSVAAVIGGDPEAGCCWLTGLDELVRATDSVIIDIGTSVN
jgi:hypothetical protein